ncbi:RNA polymerase subunit sigma-70 [Humibacillus sp. DSM 29435]|nr:RNA polymerase subunit sigma-70 [Humibacillus sp. DSM 29435]
MKGCDVVKADEPLAEAFEEERRRLMAVAYRMLGSKADAEDVVQEAWLRLARQDAGIVENLSGWSTTVVSRICIDVLRSRKTKPEVLYDEIPELLITEEGDGSLEDGAVLAESVSLALLVVLEALGPAERVAFVLHDMFAIPFEEIGQIIGRSGDAAKVAASRARRKVHGTHRATVSRRQERAVVDAFLDAARHGDFGGLLQVLDPDVVWRSHTARGVVVKLGSTAVASRAQRGARAKGSARSVRVNGQPGIVVWSLDGRPLSVMACTVVGGRILDIVSVTDPQRLATLELGEPPDLAPGTGAVGGVDGPDKG